VDVAAEVLHAVHRLDATPFVGGMLELGIGRAAGVAVASLAATLTDDAVPADIGPTHAYVEVDVTEPLIVGRGGGLVVPSGPGIGVAPDPVVLDAHTVRRHIVELP
jgi:O-succinylbenzoate synthase